PGWLIEGGQLGGVPPAPPAESRKRKGGAGCRRRPSFVDRRRGYWTMISTRRFFCSRTPSAVGTAGSLSPRPAVVIFLGSTPAEPSASRTESARRSDSFSLYFAGPARSV